MKISPHLQDSKDFFEILMITLVFSPKQHLPKHMQHSVRWKIEIFFFVEKGISVVASKNFQTQMQ